ncbi:MAG: DNA recombination protein RmuC, partial [Haliea sp.]|uniref:DNA recombination protein RmuC n=1 Tax=Haliea sp. TaxID=1932666 RepID=UPI0032EDEA49
MPAIPIPALDQAWMLPVAALVVGLALGAAAALVLRLRQLHRQHGEQARRLAQLGNRHQALRSEYDRLLARQQEQERLHKAQLQLLKESREQLKLEFEHLANRIFEARGRQFNDSSRATLSDLLQPFREQITSFQQRIDQVHSESLKGHALLEGELRKVLDVGLQMTSQASNLASALKG